MRIGALCLGAFLATGCASALGDGTAMPPRSPSAPVAAPTPASPAAAPREKTAFDFDKGEGHYVGGMARAVVPATSDTVLAALDDVPALSRLLPRTKSATLLGEEGNRRKVELVQGNSFVTARYTVILEPTSTPGEVAFRLDRSRPHDIRDVYGYFRVEGTGRGGSVVTVAASVDLGSGLLELMFGKRVQDIILSAPDVMREYFRQRVARPETVALNTP